MNKVFNNLYIWAAANKTELIIFGVAFGVKFVYGLAVQLIFGSHGFASHSDAFSFYLRGAENLVNHGIFSLNTNAPFMPDAYRTPLYTLLVAGTIWLGWPLYSLIFVQNLLAGAVGVLAYRLGLIVSSSRKVALFAALLTIFEPLSFHWNNLLMSDYAFMFFLIFAIYEFFRGRLYLFAFLLGLATLTRPMSLYFFPLLVLASMWQEYRAGRNWQKINWGKFFIAALIFLLVIFPWALRNKIVFSTWQLTTAFWYNLYELVMQKFAAAQGIAAPDPIVPPDYPNSQNFVYDFQNVGFYQQNFWRIFWAHPLAYTVFHARLAVESLFVNYYDNFITFVLKAKMPQLFANWAGWSGSLIYSLGKIFWGLWMAACALAVVAFGQRNVRLWWLTFAAMTVFIMLTHGVSGLYGLDGSRFFMPVAPFVFIFAGIGAKFLYEIYETWLRRKI